MVLALVKLSVGIGGTIGVEVVSSTALIVPVPVPFSLCREGELFDLYYKSLERKLTTNFRDSHFSTSPPSPPPKKEI